MKKFFLRFIAIGFAFSIAMLSASAQTTRLVKNANDAGAGSLRDAVSSAAVGDIIRIDGTSSNFLHKGVTTITLTSGAISFATDNLVFKGFYNDLGDTVKVSGNHVSSVISTTTATLVTLDSMYLINGSASVLGGGIAATNGGVLITNSTISGNTAIGYGGGVYGTGVIVINNSTIKGNTTNGFGGSIFANGIIIITNSTISGSTAIGNGGGVYVSTNATITNSTISGNTGGNGGGVYAGTATITNSTISGNTSDNSGGIYVNANTSITNSTITGNTGVLGGGVYASSINITGSIAALNTGGDLYDHTTATSNITTDGGYNIFSDVPTGTVSTDHAGLTFLIHLGALANNGGSTLTMLPGSGSFALWNGNPADHTADQRGTPWISGTIRSVGAVNRQQTTWLVENNNDAGSGSLRAAASSALTGDIIRIDGTSSNFLNKGVTTITLTSGPISFYTDHLVFKGFYNATGDTVKVSGTNATNGIFYISTAIVPTSMVTFDSMFLINGVTSDNGGAVYNTSGSITVLNSIFNGNQVNAIGGSGGAIYANSNAIISNSSFIGNKALGAGGAIAATNGTVTISNSTISGSIGFYGGGIAGGNVNINNSTINGNFAINTGAVVAQNSINITNSTVSGNSGSSVGSLFAKNVTITNCTISGNTASTTGSAIGGGVAARVATITNSTIIGNTAETGGGVYAFTMLNITGSIVALNTGGDVYDSTTSSANLTTNGGYNIFSDVPIGTVSTDHTGVSPAQLNLGVLANNGGSTMTMLPGLGSIAIGNGNPTDHTADQRGSTWNSGTTRSVGAVNIAVSTAPVKLLSFSGSAINNQAVLLSWVTATESNNKGFSLLRSTDNGGTFEQITFVNSLAPNGNNTGILSYNYTDNTPSNGINLYRLKQVDFDGNYIFSDVVSVEINSQIQLQISPNPTSGTLHVQGAAAGTKYRVFDIKAQSIKEGILDNARIDVSGLSAGMYILQMESNTGQIQTAKFIKE